MPARTRPSRRGLHGWSPALGFALSLALAVSTTAAHVASWSFPYAERLSGELIARCPFLSSTGHLRVWIPVLANAAGVILAVAFFDAWRRCRDSIWQTILWLLLAAFAAVLVHAATGIPVHFV